MLEFCAEGRGFNPQSVQNRRYFTSPVTFGAHLSLISSDSLTPRNSRMNVEGENVTGYRYTAHLYCLMVQASFYSDAVECWEFFAAGHRFDLGQVRTEDIFLHLLHTQHKKSKKISIDQELIQSDPTSC